MSKGEIYLGKDSSYPYAIEQGSSVQRSVTGFGFGWPPQCDSLRNVATVRDISRKILHRQNLRRTPSPHVTLQADQSASRMNLLFAVGIQVSSWTHTLLVKSTTAQSSQSLTSPRWAPAERRHAPTNRCRWCPAAVAPRGAHTISSDTADALDNCC